MSRYVVGDLQGCCDELKALLDTISFGGDDELWLVGDLVNRGPKSLETLRFLYSIKEQVRGVLGNHDLHTLAIYYGPHQTRKKDTIDPLLTAEDTEQLLRWLTRWPLAIYEDVNDFLICHAGILPTWTADQALALSAEVERVIQGKGEISACHYFENMYGNKPDHWEEHLDGMARLRTITNVFTRMRFIDDAGRLNMTHKEGVSAAPEGFKPWFEYPRVDRTRVIFGHWAAINGDTHGSPHVALDTGCVWGGSLRAWRIEDSQIFEVPSQQDRQH